MYYSDFDSFYKWVDHTVKKGIRNAVERNSRCWFNKYSQGIGMDIVSINKCFPIDSEDYSDNLGKLDLFMRMAAADDTFAEKLRLFMGKHVHMGRDGVAIAVHAMQRELVREYVHQNTRRYMEYWNRYERKIGKARQANLGDFNLWIDEMVKKSIANAVRNGSDTWFEYIETTGNIRVHWRRLREGLPDFGSRRVMIGLLGKFFHYGSIDPSFQYMLETKTNGRFPLDGDEFRDWFIALMGDLVWDYVNEHARLFMDYWNGCVEIWNDHVKGNGNV